MAASQENMVVHKPEESTTHPGRWYFNVTIQGHDALKGQAKAVLARVPGVAEVKASVNGNLIVRVLPGFDEYAVANDIRDRATDLYTQIRTAPLAPAARRATPARGW